MPQVDRRQSKNKPQKKSFRFLIALIIVFCVGSIAWGVASILFDASACTAYIEGLKLKRQGQTAAAYKKFLEAEVAIRQTLEARKKQNGSLNADVANDTRNLARVLLELGKTDECLKEFSNAEEMFVRIHAESNIDYTATLQDHSDVLVSQNRIPEAEQLIQKSLAVIKGTPEPDKTGLGYGYQRLSNVYSKLGRVGEAKEAMEKAEIYLNGGTPK